MQPSVSKSAGHFLLLDGFLSSIEMHGLSHEYLLQAILPTIQSSDSFSDGINIFAPEESVYEERIFSAPLFVCSSQYIAHIKKKHALISIESWCY